MIGRSKAEPLPFIRVGITQPAVWTSTHETSRSPIHVAFKGSAALAAGSTDNGAPGPRGPARMKYYAAFVLDPDGNNIEAGVRE